MLEKKIPTTARGAEDARVGRFALGAIEDPGVGGVVCAGAILACVSVSACSYCLTSLRSPKGRFPGLDRVATWHLPHPSKAQDRTTQQREGSGPLCSIRVAQGKLIFPLLPEKLGTLWPRTEGVWRLHLVPLNLLSTG